MKNMKKKGFTLVELLVVIAIIAILATVSVVGYTAFIEKANDSNAMTELSQIKDAVNAVVLDGSETIDVAATDDAAAYTVLFTYTAAGKLQADVLGTDANGDPTVTAATSAQVVGAMLTLTEMKLGDDQSLAVTFETITTTVGEGAAAVEVTINYVKTVNYTYATGSATWTVETGDVK